VQIAGPSRPAFYERRAVDRNYIDRTSREAR
jgi:hypothetical protein